MFVIFSTESYATTIVSVTNDTLNSTQQNVTFIISLNASSISAGQGVRVYYNITNLYPYCSFNSASNSCGIITSNLITASQIRMWFGTNLTYQTISVSLYGAQSSSGSFDMTVPTISSSCYDIKAELVYTDIDGNQKWFSSNVLNRGTCLSRNTTGQACRYYTGCQEGLFCMDTDNNGVLDTCEPSSTSYGYLCEQYGVGTSERVSAIDQTCKFAYPWLQNKNIPNGLPCRYQQDCVNSYCWDSNGNGTTVCNSVQTPGNSTGINASTNGDCSSSACFSGNACYSNATALTRNGVTETCDNGKWKYAVQPTGNIKAEFRNVTYNLTYVSKNSTHIIINATFTNNESSTFTLVNSYFYFGNGASTTRSIGTSLTQGQNETEQYVVSKPSSNNPRYYTFYVESLISNSTTYWWTTTDYRCYDSLNDTIGSACAPSPLSYSNNVTSNPSQYDGSTLSWFNATWNDTTCNSSGNRCWNVSLLETNYTGSLTNYSMSANGNTSYLNFVMPAGTFQWRIIANDSSNNWNATPVLTYTINKANPTLVLSNNTASVNTSGLVGYWKFDEGSGTLAFDSSGNGNTGNLSSNLQPDGGFESGIGPWSGGTIVTSPVHSGTNSLNVTGQSGIDGGAISVTSGVNYTWGGWCYMTTGTSGRFDLMYYDGSWHSDVNEVYCSGPTGQWNYVAKSVTLSGTTTQVKLRLVVDASGYVDYFDDVFVQQNGTWVSGMFGSGLSFNGNQFVNVTQNSNLLTANNFSVQVWFKTSSNGVLFSEQNAANPGTPTSWDPMLYVESNGTLHGGIYTGSAPTLQSSNIVNDGNWHQAVLVVNGANSKQYLYVDGVSTGSFSGNPESPTSFNYIGTGYTYGGWPNTNSSWYYFNGTIDEVQIWNRTLIASEINELYQSYVVAPASTTFTGSNCPSVGASDVSCKLYRNTSLIGSGSPVSDTQTLNHGFYYYIYNTTGGANWTVNSILIPLRVNATIVLTIESPQKNNVGTIVSRPSSNIFTYGTVSYSDGMVLANQLINFAYGGNNLGTNTTASDGTYNFTFSVPYSGNYSFSVNTTDVYGTFGSNSTILYISNTPQNVKYRLSYHIGSTKTDDIENTGNFNESVDSLSMSRFFYSSDPNLKHAYTCTYDTNTYPAQLVSLVHSYQRNNLNYINFTANPALTDYILELSQKIAGSSLILAYTQGDCSKINNDMYLVESNQIPSHAFSSFSFGIPNEIELLIRAQYDKIDINGSDIFGAGTNNICISNDGVNANNYHIVTVKRC